MQRSGPAVLSASEEGCASRQVVDLLQRLSPSPKEQKADDDSTQEIHEVMFYKGNDFLTKFYGYSYHRNLYQQVFNLRLHFCVY
jgi:hypothetical protein